MKHTVISFSKFNFIVYSVVVYGFKAIGLAPFSFRRNATCGLHNDVRIDRTQPFAFSKVGSVYNLLLIIPILVFSINRLVTNFALASNETSVSNSINNAAYVTRKVATIGSACVILIVWSLRQKKAAAALNLLHEISARLSTLGKQSVNKWAIATFAIHVTINAVLWITVLIFAINYTSLRNFMISISRYASATINFWFGIEYSMMVGFVAQNFQVLNHCLTNYRELNFSLHPRVWMNTCVTHRDDRPASIRLLRGLRMSLIELCDEIADFFSLPIFFFILHSFSAFVIDTYNLFIYAFQPNVLYSHLVADSSAALWSLVIIGMFVYPTIVLALNVTRAKQEAGLTGRIINKLSFQARDDSEIQQELNQFSRELQNANADVFTAYGFFSLDSTLLLSILASTATYFVVFLQLRTPSCDPGNSGNYTDSTQR